MSTADHLHTYNLRGYCWCGEHRDDWLHDEDMLDKIGNALSSPAISRERLKEQIAAAPDLENDAGLPLAEPEPKKGGVDG